MTSLSIYDPAFQYQKQKVIQNTVRVPSSLYTMNLGALSVYQNPTNQLHVNWNQMSDRSHPHKQPGSGYSQGSTYHGSSTRHTQTRDRPGASTPGGVGVDIKHNSYNRYLSKIKAVKPIRRGAVPPTYGTPIVFNRAFPIYGGKTVKTAINDAPNFVCSSRLNNNGHCSPSSINAENSIINKVRTAKLDKTNYSYVFAVGQTVYSRQTSDENYEKSTVIAVLGNNLYTLQTLDLNVYNTDSSNILPQYYCNYSIDNLYNDYYQINSQYCQQYNDTYVYIDTVNYAYFINLYLSQANQFVDPYYFG
jgi:hypothetical protein